MNPNNRIRIKPYIQYKFVNSVFTGLSAGAVFVIYGILEPSIFSVGGIVLAIGTFSIAKYYSSLMQLRAYYWTTLATEVIILVAALLILILPKSEFLALVYYSMLNLVFVFGTYLMRFESTYFKNSRVLTAIDSAKQIGQLVGLALSWLFYESLKLLKSPVGIEGSWDQIHKLHWIIVAVQLLTFILCLRSFKKIVHRA
jgi:hypothetical protein